MSWGERRLQSHCFQAEALLGCRIHLKPGSVHCAVMFQSTKHQSQGIAETPCEGSASAAPKRITAEPRNVGHQCPLCPCPFQPVLCRALLTGPSLALLHARVHILHAPLRRGPQSNSHPTGINMQGNFHNKHKGEFSPSGEPLPKKCEEDTTSSAGLRSAINRQCCW